MTELSGTQWSISKRPKTLPEVYGQDHITTYFQNIKHAGKPYPASIWLNGRFGNGKTTIAKIIAKSIQCRNVDADGNPCNECASCKSIDNETFGRDTIMFNAGTDGVIDSVRRLLEDINIPPMLDRNKVVIVEEAQQLEPKATQAFLKAVEKPRSNIHFIFTSMEEDSSKMEKFDALISRSKRFDIKLPTTMDLMMYLKNIMEKEGLWADESIPKDFKFNGLKSIATNSKNSYREAIQILEKCIDSKSYTKEEMSDQFGIVNSDTIYDALVDILNGKGSELAQNAFFTGSLKSREAYFTKSYNIVIAAKTLKAFAGDDADTRRLISTISYYLDGFDEGDFDKLKKIATHKNLEVLTRGFHNIKVSPLGLKDWFNCADELCSVIIDCKNNASTINRVVEQVSTIPPTPPVATVPTRTVTQSTNPVVSPTTPARVTGRVIRR